MADEEEFIVYTRRYFMLLMFASLNFLQAFQWIEYSIITNIIVRFYGVSVNDVNWTSVICFLVLVPLIIPCTWILETVGLRNYLIIGAVFNFVGTIIKCMSVNPILFWVTLFGQGVSGMSTAFIEPMSAQMARTWFPKDKVSRATAFGVFSMFLGTLTSSIVPMLMVPNSQNKKEIAAGLSHLFIGQGVIAAIQLVLVVVFFEEKPPTAPSKAEDTASKIRSSHSYLRSMKKVLNKNFILLLFVYGICGSEVNSYLTVLNEMILTKFKDQEKLVGIIGFLGCTSALGSTFVNGYILDKFKCYKLMIFLWYGSSCFLFLILALVMYVKSIALMIGTNIILGFTLNAYSTIIFNFGAELTYPEPGGVSSALCVLSSRLLSALVTFTVSGIISFSGVVAANIFYAVLLVIAMIMTAFVKNDSSRNRHENYMTAIIDAGNEVTVYQSI